MTRHPGTICAPALRLWPLAAWLAVAWLAAPALAASWLVPGEPLTEAHLAALVEAELPPHGDGFELSFTSPSLPLTNPAASRASLELVDLRLLAPGTHQGNQQQLFKFAGQPADNRAPGRKRYLAKPSATGVTAGWSTSNCQSEPSKSSCPRDG